MVSAIVAMRVGSSSASSRSKKAAIFVSNAETVAPTRSTRVSIVAPWASISPSRAVLRFPIRASVSSRTRAISAFDHSRTAGDVIVGMTPQRGDLLGGGVVDLLDDGLRVGGEASHRLVARGLGGDLHRAAEIGHELRRATRGGRCGLLDHGGCRCLLSVRGFIGDGSLDGVRHRLVGFGPIRIPRKSETSSGIGLGHRARSSFGTSGGGHT